VNGVTVRQEMATPKYKPGKMIPKGAVAMHLIPTGGEPLLRPTPAQRKLLKRRHIKRERARKIED
jgi:hypothetical protein